MSLKKLQESLQDIKDEMTKMVETAQTEQRELSSEEISKFDELEAKSTSIKDEINSINERKANMTDTNMEARAIQERKEFADCIRAMVEHRDSDVNFDKTSNGVAIPTTIVNDIITKVEEISPLFAKARKFVATGNVVVPKEDASSTDFACAYADEFEELTATASKLGSVELKGYLSGILAKISKSLLNNTNLDLTAYVVERMANAVAKFIDGELFNGTAQKIAGLTGYDSTNMKVTFAGSTPTADELIDIQEKVPDALQGGCEWYMGKATKTAIRKLKDGENRYLLIPDFSQGGKYTLLGQPVHITDAITDGSVWYVNGAGLGIKEAEKMSIQVLNEKFATQHAIGLVGWEEFDAKVINGQAIAKGEVAGTP